MEINPTQQPAMAATRPARRVAPRLLLATLVALPLTLAACSTQTEAPPAPLPMPSVNTATPSAAASESAAEASPAPTTPQPREIEPPVPSDVALENSADGAEAYAYFLFQAWWYLINTHDIDWWDTNIPDCDWKTQMRDSAVYQDGRGITNETAPIHPHVISRKVNPENGNEFGITLHTEVGDIYNIAEDGSKMISAPAKKYELIARLLHDGNSWKAVTIVTRGAEETQ
ncbi:DUF6318 family protein [Buchananella felis]|uniref:DUF6318 family protein n=1 Tax=Buchananella felis TaxID=3231492 RepID=UPI003526F815